MIGYALVAVANAHLSALDVCARDIKAERVQIAAAEKEMQEAEREKEKPVTRIYSTRARATETSSEMPKALGN